jgi:cytochrome c biogenesis protein
MATIEQQRVGSNGAPVWRLLVWLGSLKFTLLALLLLLAVVVRALTLVEGFTWWLAPPLGVLALNLLAAILVNPLFRRQLPLLLFHLALLALIVLVGVGRMIYLKGWAEVSEGAAFDGQLVKYEAGPWHRWALDQVRFVNERFTINYAPGPRRTTTLNQVRLFDETGGSRVQVIGDDRPLIMQGYRFYTTFNKGYAPVFQWRPDAAASPLTGDVRLPPFPGEALRQHTTWNLPGLAEPVWVQLEFDETILAEERASVFRPPARHHLILRSGERRFEMTPGDQVRLGEAGLLRYQGLRTWMGYNVAYDWTQPWLVAAVLLAVFSLAWHMGRKYRQRSWLSSADNRG